MGFMEWVVLIVGTGLIVSGARAVRRRQVNILVHREGAGAVRLGWLWIGMGVLFLLGVIFDVVFLKTLFRLYLEAAN